MNKINVKYKDKILITIEDIGDTITLQLHPDTSTQGLNEVKIINAMLRTRGIHPLIKAKVIRSSYTTGFKFDFDFYKTRSFVKLSEDMNTLVIDKNKLQEYKNKC